MSVVTFLERTSKIDKSTAAIIGGKIEEASLLGQLNRLDSSIVSSNASLLELKRLGENYNEVLRKVLDVVKRISGRDEGGWERDGNTLVTIKMDYVEKIKSLIHQLSECTEEIDSATDFDEEALMIPLKITDYLNDAKKRGWCECKSVVSLSMLRSLQEDKASNVCDANGIPYASANRIKELCLWIESLIKKFALCNQWIHDANHYMCRLMNRIECFNKNQTKTKNIHSIDAMLQALVTLRNDFEEEMGWSTPETSANFKYRFYYPYKLFHKFRYCYDNEGVCWVAKGEKFTSAVRYARGMESVALNIYGNAVKYLSKFGGHKEVCTSFERFDDAVEIVISSMGPVVKDSERDRLCEDGYRSESVRGIYTGRGRGLSLSDRICKEAGYEFIVDPDAQIRDTQRFAKFNVIIRIPLSCVLDSRKDFGIR